MAKIIGVGEICVLADYASSHTGVMSSSAYALATMANFGDEPYMVSMMADDAVSHDICSSLKLYGINMDCVGFKENKDNIIAVKAQNGDVCYYLSDNALFEMGWDYIDMDKLLDAKWCYITIDALAGKYTRNVVIPMLRLLKGKEINIACDINYKKAFWQNEEIYRKTAFTLASLSDCVVIDGKDKTLADEIKDLKEYICFERYDNLTDDNAKGAFFAGLIHSICDGVDIKKAILTAQNAADFVIKNGGGFDALPGMGVLI